jgi:hypothetical protein
MGRPLHYHVALHKKERSLAFCEILEGVVGAETGGFSLGQLKKQTIDPTKPFPVYRELHEGFVPVCLNAFLEAGNRLETAFPGMGTDFHYPFKLTEMHYGVAGQLVKRAGENVKLFGVYTSAGQIVQSWRGWRPLDWVKFISMWVNDHKDEKWVPMIIGAPYDMGFTDVVEEKLRYLHSCERPTDPLLHAVPPRNSLEADPGMA